jgi:Holliday junction resolvasome RuvABC endonuclease subunit
VTAIIGIDPSLDGTGLAWDDQLATVRGTGDKRLVEIRLQVAAALRVGRARLAIVEDLPTHAKGAGLTGMAQGVIRLTLLQERVPYVLVPAATLKKYATGRGNATKPDMRVELLKRAGLDVRDDNQVDAWWLRALGADLSGDPLLVMPAVNRNALSKLPAAVMP